MSDIVERLRDGYPCLEGSSDHTCKVRNAASGCLCASAADEIERLRAALLLIRDMGPMTVDDQRWRVARDALERK